MEPQTTSTSSSVPQPVAEQKAPVLEAQLPATPQVYFFQDYRKFLKAWFDWKKQTQPSYSGALFARKAGLQSHTLLGMVIRGERNIGYETIRAFGKALGLKAREKVYFEKLVLFNQSKKSEDRADFFEQLVMLSQGEGKNLLTQIQDYARCLSHWYVVAVHELVAMDEFKADPDWISQKLKKKITKKEAAEAWSILLNLGMVKLSPVTGRFEQVHPPMDFDPGMVDFAIRNFHKEFLDRARDAVDQEPMSERELSSLTIAVSDEDLPSLKEKVKEFRKQINLIYSEKSKQSKPKHVVSVNMQLLVLTDPSTAGSGRGGETVEAKKKKSGE